MAKQKAPPAPAAEAATPQQGYTVLARRYRPQQFADLVGQEAVARALTNALKSNRVAHAYLFTGVRGVGKTSAARILAKALNCVQGPTTTPCDQCDICKSIAAGEDVDVLEIDGASNNSVDDVRELRQNAQFRPSRSRYRIYIIDEVHMLAASPQKSAFNALLKTLEEPPPHVKFIFATTEVQKIPATILSRCQRFEFAGIGSQHIVDRLRAIVAGEGMSADDEALVMVARRAGGSMRDAQSLLDQLLAFGGERLTADQVHQLLGTAGDDRVLELAAAVLGRDAARALELLGRAADEGLQLGELLDQLIAYWRDLMVLNSTGGQAADLNVAPRHRDTLAKQAAALQLDTILAGLDVLASTRARLRSSNHGRVLFEMALVRLGRLDDLVALSQLSQWLGQGGPARANGGPAAAGPRPAGVAAPPEGVKKKLPAVPEAAPVTAPAAPGPLPLSVETLPRVWQAVLAQAGPILGNELEKAVELAISGPNTLVIRFPPQYNRAREFCQDTARVARIEELLRRVAGQSWQLRLEAVGGTPGAEAPRAADDLANLPSRTRRQRAEAVQEQPLLKRAIDVLGAQVVHLDDGFGAAPAGAVGPEGDGDGEEA